jgi:hypothetical protein
MGADKNSSRGRLKLRQDELARSNPRKHTLRTSTSRLPKPRSHWSVLTQNVHLTPNTQQAEQASFTLAKSHETCQSIFPEN